MGKSIRCILVSSILVLSIVAFLSLSALDDNEKAPMLGTWKLVSLELRSEDGQVSYPLGKDASGYIIYGEDGCMFVALMGADRPKFTVDDSLGGSIEERAGAYSTYFSYCGPYEIRDSTVIHHIELCSFPNWCGVDQERIFEFKDDKLILSTRPYFVGGKQQTAYVIWERF